MATNSQLAPQDICRNRHKGAEQSVMAFARVLPYITKQQREAYEWLLTKGEYGGTVKELQRETGMAYTSASARLSELVHELFVAEDTDDVREHCTVRRAVAIG